MHLARQQPLLGVVVSRHPGTPAPAARLRRMYEAGVKDGPAASSLQPRSGNPRAVSCGRPGGKLGLAALIGRRRRTRLKLFGGGISVLRGAGPGW